MGVPDASCNTCWRAPGEAERDACAKAKAALALGNIICPDECPLNTMSRMQLTIQDGTAVTTRGRI